MRTAVLLYAVAGGLLAAIAAAGGAPSNPALLRDSSVTFVSERSNFPPRRLPLFPPPDAADAASGKLAIEDLGGGLYRIDAIVVDTMKQAFSVPAMILDHVSSNLPVNVLAVAEDSPMIDESAFRVQTNALAFDVACLLIGLDAEAAGPQGSDLPAGNGVAVTVTFSWQSKGRTVTKPASAFIRHSGTEPVTDDWAYFGPDPASTGAREALSAGALIGLGPEEKSIIRLRSGFVGSKFGVVAFDGAAAPRVGTEVTVTVARALR